MSATTTKHDVSMVRVTFRAQAWVELTLTIASVSRYVEAVGYTWPSPLLICVFLIRAILIVSDLHNTFLKV